MTAPSNRERTKSEVTHEEAHDALVCVNSYPESTAKIVAARTVQRYILQGKEQTAKLARAMAVVGAALSKLETYYSSCLFCRFDTCKSGAGFRQLHHDQECQLVVNGFIDREGKRLP